MSPGFALALLGFGIGALVVTGQSNRENDRTLNPRAVMSAQERAALLRARTAEAQKLSARVSQHARDLAAQWSAADDEARKGA